MTKSTGPARRLGHCLWVHSGYRQQLIRPADQHGCGNQLVLQLCESHFFLPQPTWPNFNPGQTPLPGQIVGLNRLTFIDPNAARPPRQNQWSIGVQREVARDLVLDATYVANRGVWWPGPLGNLNQVSPQVFASLRPDPSLESGGQSASQSTEWAAPPWISRGSETISPYPGYATTNTLLNALRPFPQDSARLPWSTRRPARPAYDSLQVKVTKRMSKGLQVNSAFTWSKAMRMRLTPISTIRRAYEKSIQATDQPFYWTTNILYQTQKYFSKQVPHGFDGGLAGRRIVVIRQRLAVGAAADHQPPTTWE